MNFKLLLTLIIITILHLSVLFIIKSIDVFAQRVENNNKGLVIQKLEKSDEEVFIKIYGIDFDDIPQSYISNLYLDYNIKLIRSVDIDKADIIIADYKNIEKYFGKYDILTFTNFHEREIVMFNKKIDHSFYLDIVLLNIRHFDNNRFNHINTMIKYVK